MRMQTALAAVGVAVTAFDKVRRLYGFRRVEVPDESSRGRRGVGFGSNDRGETNRPCLGREKGKYVLIRGTPEAGGEKEKRKKSITLRPTEFTAGIVAAYLSEDGSNNAPLEGSSDFGIGLFR